MGAVVNGLPYWLRLATIALGAFAASALWNLHTSYARWGADTVPAYAMARAFGAGTAGALVALAVAVLLLRRNHR